MLRAVGTLDTTRCFMCSNGQTNKSLAGKQNPLSAVIMKSTFFRLGYHFKILLEKKIRGKKVAISELTSNA